MRQTARILVMAWDGAPQPPVRADADPGAESGRGLMLVEAVSSRWGWYHDRESATGKVVWAEIGSSGPVWAEHERQHPQRQDA